MKALVIERPGAVGYVDVAEPVVGDGEVLLRVDVLGFCGTDLNTFRGRNPLVTFPRIPGHEMAATILALGAGVPPRFHEGQRVTVLPFTGCGICRVCRLGRENCCAQLKVLGVQKDGAFLRHLTVPWQKLYPSDTLAPEELALVEPLTIGFHAAARGRVTGEDKVLVLGCGTIGIAAIAAAAFAGATVAGLDVASAKFPLARAAGATWTIDPMVDDLESKVRELFGNDGPTVVIEAVGSPTTYRQAIDLAGHGARVVYIGWPKGEVSYDAGRVVFKELDVMGSRNSFDQFEPVMHYLGLKRFPVDQAITKTVAFDEAAEALREWDRAPESVNKIQIVVTD